MIQIPAPMVNADTLPVKTHLARWRAANAMAAKKVLSPIPESATVASAVENPAMLVTSYLIILVFFLNIFVIHGTNLVLLACLCFFRYFP